MNLKGIYKITNLINNKVYIGSSNNLKQRLRQHKSFLKLNQHCNKHLQTSYNKYSSKNFSFNILEIIDDETLLDKKEQYYINLFDSTNNIKGYNKRIIANSNRGRKVSDIGRLNMSKGQKGKKFKKEDILKRAKTQEKIVLMYDINKQFLRYFMSQKEASSFINKHYTTLSKAIKYDYPCQNYYWKNVSKIDLITGNCNQELCELLENLSKELKIQYMTISSQALQECSEGSTTNVYDPERIMKQHERTTSYKDDDIVCTLEKSKEFEDKILKDNI